MTLHRSSTRSLIVLSLACLALALLPQSAAQAAAGPSPDNKAAAEHVKRGDALRDKEDWKGALEEYRQATQLNSADPYAHYGLGLAYGETGKSLDATRELRETVRLKPDWAEAHNALGWYEPGGEAARKEFREAIRLKPEYLKPRFNLALSLANDGDYDGALREYRDILRIKPNDATAHYGVGWALGQKGDINGALAEYQEANRLNPKDSDTHQGLGFCLLRKGDFDGALREYQEAVKLDPKDADAHYGEATTLARKAQFDAAISEFNEAIRLSPKMTVAHLGLARALERKGQKAAAMEEYRKAADLDPKNSSAKEGYDRLHRDAVVGRFVPAGWVPSVIMAFLVSSALVPSFLLMGYFRARDLYPEPAKVLWTTFALGVFIVIPVLLLDWPLDLIVKLFHGAIPHSLAEALFTAAIPEELLKFAVVMLYCLRNKEFDEPMDGIVYGAIASLGFASFENVMYVADGGFSLALSRALTAVPGHAFMGAVMGYFVGQWRFTTGARRPATLLKAYLVPVGLHWMYDFPLLSLQAAGKLTGEARKIAMSMVTPLVILSVVILVSETIWAIVLVNRMHKGQIQLARDAAAAAAEAQGAMDIVALMRAPQAPSKRAGWVMAIVGGFFALIGGFLTLLIAVALIHDAVTGQTNSTGVVIGAAMVGCIPLLAGLVVFVFGTKRIHAARHILAAAAAPPMAAAAGA